MEETQIKNFLKRGVYKLENGEFEEAEKIFEDLAIEADLPIAWIQIGNIKLSQVGLGKATVRQVLNCFERAVSLAPGERRRYEDLYASLSLEQLHECSGLYKNIRRAIKENKSGKTWNYVLAGASAAIGAKKGNGTGNNTFRAFAGAAGAAYGLHRAAQKSTQVEISKNTLIYLEKSMMEIATLPSLSALISRIGGWPKKRRYSRLNWLALS